MPRRSGFPANLPDHWIPAECQPGGEKQGVSVLMMDYQWWIMNILLWIISWAMIKLLSPQCESCPLGKQPLGKLGRKDRLTWGAKIFKKNLIKTGKVNHSESTTGIDMIPSSSSTALRAGAETFLNHNHPDHYGADGDLTHNVMLMKMMEMNLGGNFLPQTGKPLMRVNLDTAEQECNLRGEKSIIKGDFFSWIKVFSSNSPKVGKTSGQSV